MNKRTEVPVIGVHSNGGSSTGAAPRFATRETKLNRGGSLLIGRLTEHGRANYQIRLDEIASYYVKLLTSRGAKTLWGRDLERALRSRETRPKVGDLVGVRRVARESVTVMARRRIAEGRIVTEEAITRIAPAGSWKGAILCRARTAREAPARCMPMCARRCGRIPNLSPVS